MAQITRFTSIMPPVGAHILDYLPNDNQFLQIPTVSKAFLGFYHAYQNRHWEKLLVCSDDPQLTAPASSVTQPITLEMLRYRRDEFPFEKNVQVDLRIDVMESEIRRSYHPLHERWPLDPADPRQRKANRLFRHIAKLIEHLGNEAMCRLHCETFVSREALISRALLARQGEGVTVSRAFRNLFEQQKALVCRTPRGQRDFAISELQNGACNFNWARFQSLEELISDVQKEVDQNLTWAWVGNNQQGIKPALERQRIDMGPAPIIRVSEMRNWLTNPDNRKKMDSIHFIALHYLNLSACPPELCAFPSLRTLWLHGNKLEFLPSEMELLVHLTSIDLSNNRLGGVPAVLLRMPGLLQAGSLINLNENPIRVLPEAVYDRFFALPHALGKPFGSYGFINRRISSWGDKGFVIARDSPNRCNEIPFALWLREHLIPNPGMIFIDAVGPFTWRCEEIDRKFWGLPSCVITFVGCLIGTPIWLINRVLSLVIVPIVTWVRDKLGYGRMIKIREDR